MDSFYQLASRYMPNVVQRIGKVARECPVWTLISQLPHFVLCTKQPLFLVSFFLCIGFLKYIAEVPRYSFIKLLSAVLSPSCPVHGFTFPHITRSSPKYPFRFLTSSLISAAGLF